VRRTERWSPSTESGLQACYGKTLHLQGFSIDGSNAVHHRCITRFLLKAVIRELPFPQSVCLWEVVVAGSQIATDLTVGYFWGTGDRAAHPGSTSLPRRVATWTVGSSPPGPFLLRINRPGMHAPDIIPSEMAWPAH
jgi:hypothetical protein